jgi:hypothetical protein
MSFVAGSDVLEPVNDADVVQRRGEGRDGAANTISAGPFIEHLR